MQPNTMGELRLDNEHLRKENARLRIVATAETMKATDLGKAVDDLNGMIDRLEAEIAALKANRWADRMDEDLEDLLDGCISPEILSEVEAELARREGSNEQ